MLDRSLFYRSDMLHSLYRMVLSMFLSKVGFVHPIFQDFGRHQHDTWTLDLSDTRRASSFRAFRVFLRHFRHLAMPYWWALRRAKQLSTSATLLCWSSISVVLMSCKVKSFYVVRLALLLCLSADLFSLAGRRLVCVKVTALTLNVYNVLDIYAVQAKATKLYYFSYIYLATIWHDIIVQKIWCRHNNSNVAKGLNFTN